MQQRLGLTTTGLRKYRLPISREAPLLGWREFEAAAAAAAMADYRSAWPLSGPHAREADLELLHDGRWMPAVEVPEIAGGLAA